MIRKKTKCTEVMNHICVSLGEDFNSKRCIRIKEHLEECESCRKYLESVKGTINLFQNDKVELSEKNTHDLLSFLNLEERV